MEFTERQQKTIAAALTTVAVMVILAVVAGFLWLLAVFVKTFSGVLLPVAVAGIAALVCKPYYDLLRVRCQLPMPVAVVALLLTVLIPLSLFAAFFGSVLVRELIDFFSNIPVWWKQTTEFLETHAPESKAFFEENPIGKQLKDSLQGQGPMIAKSLEYFAETTLAAGAGIASWTSGLLNWAVTPVYFVFLLIMRPRNMRRLDQVLPFLKQETRDDVVFLAKEFVNIVVSFFRGQIVIAFIQGVLLAIGFSLVGLKYGFVLGFVLGFLNIIPYLGSMVGIAITFPLAYFQDGGGILLLISVIVVLLIVQTIEGYYLTPKIMGSTTGLHPMAIIFAIFFWGTALDGILGMILAIPLTAFLVIFWRLAKEKYIPEIV